MYVLDSLNGARMAADISSLSRHLRMDPDNTHNSRTSDGACVRLARTDPRTALVRAISWLAWRVVISRSRRLRLPRRCTVHERAIPDERIVSRERIQRGTAATRTLCHHSSGTRNYASPWDGDICLNHPASTTTHFCATMVRGS